MKKLILTSICAFILVTGYTQGIDFFHGKWEDALAKAQEEEKLLFVDSYTTWCGPCKKMSRDIFPNAEVGAYFNEKFISIKLDMEKEDGMRFGMKYPVRAYPTMFFISGDGKVVYKMKGSKPVAAFLAEARTALSKYDRSDDFAQMYEAGERSNKFMIKYIKELNKSNKPSLKIANDYLKSKPDITEQALARFVFAATTQADSKIFDLMIEKKSLILEEEDEATWNNKILSVCSKSVDTAIAFEYRELIIETIEKIKDQLGKKASKKFECEALSAYSKSQGDHDSYFEYMKKYVTKLAKKDPLGLQWAIRDLQASFLSYDDNKMLALEAAKRLYKIEDTNENAILYAIMLDSRKDREKALIVLEERIKNLKKKSEPTKLIDNAIKRLRAS